MTPSQLTTLRAACLADSSAAAFFIFPGNAAGLRTYLNGPAGVNAWRTDAPTDAIFDAIDSTKFTPTATITGTEVEPMLSRKRGWIDEVDLKLMVLQNMMLARTTINAARPNIRGSLRDVVTQLPTGALDGNGKPALMSAGGANGANVFAACVRPATRAEVFLAAASQASDTTGTTTARVLTFEGDVQEQEAAALIYRDNGTIWSA